MEQLPSEVVTGQSVGDLASRTPAPVKGDFPYLVEKATGIVHPYTSGMARRGDLVIGCYNRYGSLDPADREERATFKRELPKRNYLTDAPAESVAEIKAREYQNLKKQALEEIKAEELAKSKKTKTKNKLEAQTETTLEDESVVAPAPLEELKIQIDNM